MNHPLLRSAAVIGYTFNQFPDQAMNCDQRTFALRLAGAKVIADMRKKGGGKHARPKDD